VDSARVDPQGWIHREGRSRDGDGESGRDGPSEKRGAELAEIGVRAVPAPCLPHCVFARIAPALWRARAGLGSGPGPPWAETAMAGVAAVADILTRRIGGQAKR
jgi:hypothetical protein